MMRKRTILVFIGLLWLLCTFAYAAPKNKAEAKKEADRLREVMEYTKKTVIPLINCYVNHQPHLQFLNGDYPNVGREHVTRMDYCSSAYPDRRPDEPKLTEFINRVIALLRQDVALGRQYCDAWETYNRTMAELRKEPKNKKSLEAQLDGQKKKIENMKQELYRHASEFQKIQKDYRAYQKDLMKRFAKARDMAK